MGSECDRTSVRAPRSVREYRLGEEIANAITHGIGALLAIAAIPVMIVTAVSHGGGAHLASAIVFGVSMLLEYLASTLYHALAHEGAKRVFKVMDHCAIYLLIAGSYTPFCLIALADHGGFVLFCIVWAAALVGMAVEAFWVFRPQWASALLYLLLGWCVVWFLPVLYASLPRPGFFLLLIGGILYSIGAGFYILKKIPYMHTVFHVLVLAGTICHFFAVELFLL